ncbi:MAG TPA: hypothetical protein V6D26_20220 [Stenomitos sp.]
MSNKYGIICLALILGLVLLPRLTLAQASGVLESRIARIEAENFQLRSQVSRIESQLAILSGRPLSSAQRLNRNIPTPQISSRTNRQPVSSSDPMFERLATLVIELKERVQSLESQVAQLKKPQR